MNPYKIKFLHLWGSLLQFLMKNTVLQYGTISGLVLAVLTLVSILIEKKYGFGTSPPALEYIGTILSFIPMYFGIREYRQTIGGGAITFLKALNVGIMIVVISGIFFAVSYLFLFYWLTPDLPEKYSAYLIEHIKASGKDLKDTILAKQQMAQFKELTKNPFVFGAFTFTEPLLPGIIITLACAAILRKNPPTITDAVVVDDAEQNPK